MSRSAAASVCGLLSSPGHAADLIDFTSDFMSAVHISETAEEARLRKVACYLSDIGWRGHPERGMKQGDIDYFAKNPPGITFNPNGVSR